MDLLMIFTLIKIVDNGNNTRLNNFDKDTARLTILRPKILLTLKADLPTKLPDNSFKTKIVMKIKNSGGLFLLPPASGILTYKKCRLPLRNPPGRGH